jgi:hypothetical protein
MQLTHFLSNRGTQLVHLGLKTRDATHTLEAVTLGRNWYNFLIAGRNSYFPGRNIISFYFYVFICGRAKCLTRKDGVGSSATVDALCSSCSLQRYLKRWPAALYEAGLSVLMLMKLSKIPGVKLNTIHLYQHYSLFMPNKLQYTRREDYCVCGLPNSLS